MDTMIFNARCGHSGESTVSRKTEDRVKSRRRYWQQTDCRACRGLDKFTPITVTAQCGHGVEALTQPLSTYPPTTQAARARYYWKNHPCHLCR